MIFPATFDNGITVIAVANPRWTNRDRIEIDADVTFSFEEGDPVTTPFTSSPFDAFGPHCPAIFEHCAALAVDPWVRPDVTVEDLQSELDAIMPDVMLGLADDSTVSLARSLRIQIKSMS